MRVFGGYRGDESDAMPRALSDQAVESLLSGRAPDDRPDLAGLADAITRFRSVMIADAPQGSADRLAEIAAATASDAGAPVVGAASARRPLGVRRFVLHGVALKVLIGSMLALTLGGGAVAGVLPDPIQRVIADAADVIGIDLPRPDSGIAIPDPDPGDQIAPSTTVGQPDSSTTNPPLPPLNAVLAVSADRDSVDEPGGPVAFAVELTNDSDRSVEVTALADQMFGDLLDPDNPLVSENTCATADLTMEPWGGLSCTYVGVVSGFGGEPDYSGVLTVRTEDTVGYVATDTATLVVAFNDVDPIVAFEVAPSATTLDEPGGDLPVAITITNRSEEPVRLTSLSDSVFGDLLDPNNPLVADSTCPALARTHRPGVTINCSFVGEVLGDTSTGPSTHSTRVAVVDRQSNRATASKTFNVQFADSLPAVAATISPSSIVVGEPGGPITFTVRLVNQSVEPVVLAVLYDMTFGNLLDPNNPAVTANTCLTKVGLPISVGGVLTCTFIGAVDGEHGDANYTSTLISRVTDNEANPATGVSATAIGFTPAGTTVGGLVFADLDGDGVRDAGEPGLGGARVSVTIGGLGSITAVTNNGGSWSALVTPGSVEVEVLAGSLPPGMGLTTGNASQTIVVSGGSQAPAAAIGYEYLPQILEGDVFVDFDGNQAMDSDEPGIPGVVVELVDSNGTAIGSTTTDSDGRFALSPAAAGQYFIRVNGGVPAGLFVSTDPDGTPDAQSVVGVGPGETVSGLDFGYRGRRIIDQSFHPVDPGAVVVLTWAGFDATFGTADDYTMSTVADAQGAYVFTNLPRGKYDVDS